MLCSLKRQGYICEDTDNKLLAIQNSGDGGFILTGNSSVIN
jgi:hypothetical protein